ncbi:MAG: TetR/AcrR family transcriptional regulator [Rhizomicrobium sp.]
MPKTRPDRRTERTRQALTTAFVELVLTKGYAAISVGDITEAANVGRSTFYMHHKSKMDLLKQSLMQPSAVLSVIVGHDVPPEMLVQQLRHFHEQRRINKPFFSEPIRTVWVKSLARLIEPRLVKLIRQTRAQPLLPPELIAVQIAEGQIALITHWLLGRASLRPEAVAEALKASTHASLAALLRVPPDAPLLLAGEKLRMIKS